MKKEDNSVERLQGFKNVLDFFTHSGLIVRQEEASMIPIFFLDLSSNHKILGFFLFSFLFLKTFVPLLVVKQHKLLILCILTSRNYHIIYVEKNGHHWVYCRHFQQV
jgi:hypothetical protein